MKKYSLIFLLAMLCGAVAFAQTSSVTHKLTASISGTTLAMPDQGFFVQDDDAADSGRYSTGYDWQVVILAAQPCPSPNVLALNFSAFDINPLDTLFVYDGPSTQAPLLVACNNNLNSLAEGRTVVYASASNNNNTHALTLRFKTTSHVAKNTGFLCLATCMEPCEIITPHIDRTFERVRNGHVYATDTMRTIDGIGTITVCFGDGIRVHGLADYTHYTGHYNPSDATSTFTWTYDDETVRSSVGMNYVSYNNFDSMACHRINLQMTDMRGCAATMFDEIRVMVAGNPIRTISNLGTVCNNELLPVQITFDTMGVLNLDTVLVRNIRSRTNNVKTFIPDGPNCAVTCYSAPVTFDEFPAGKTVLSGQDICSICVNYEHEYMGDYDLRIVCPTGKTATLKSTNAPGGYPGGAGGGGGTFTGYPYGGNNHHSWDGGSGRYCDSIYNMYGIGLDYCFSRNENYTLVDGLPANTTRNGNHYLASSGYTDQVRVTFPDRPAYSRSGSGNAGTQSFSTKRPSNYADASNYYKPADDFSSLVGCPLNGVWNIQICDTWGSDNGWVFGWGMDICSVTDRDDCEYSVGIDSVNWTIPERNYRTVNGRRFGPEIHRDSADKYRFYMSAHDTAGTFWVDLHVHDAFGCNWDSVGYFTTLWAPEPDLGEDKAYCLEGISHFYAYDRHAFSPENDYWYTYEWNTGDTTADITVSTAQTTDYSVTVRNHSIHGGNAICQGIDSVRVIIGLHPQPRIYPDSIGKVCSPYSINFENNSLYASEYLWNFGDGSQSTEKDPVHRYSVGTYSLTLYAISPDGCSDTLYIPNYITLMPPEESVDRQTMCHGASFTWMDGVTYTEPTSTPIIKFINRNGCDSVVHLNLSLDNSTRALIHATPEVATYDNPRILLIDYGVNSIKRTWWLPNGDTSNLVQAPFNFPISEDSVRIILAIESELGCRDTTSVILYMDKAQVWMPNIFTPEEPNNNRVRIVHHDLDKVECVIYDRRGQMVYSFKDKDDEWDGKHEGRDCVQGAYVYRLRYTTKLNPDRWQYQTGTIVLLR